MSGPPCQQVRDALLEGSWDHAHLAACPACRRFADAVALTDGALHRGPVAEPAPPGLVAAITRRAISEATRRQRRLLLVATCVTGLATLAGAAVLLSLLPSLTPELPTPGVVRLPEHLVAAFRDGAAGLAGGATVVAGVLYALLGAGLVHLLSWEP